MLHIIDHYPIEPSELEKTSYGDTVLFIENAIYAAIQSNAAQQLIAKASAHLNFCVRSKDIKDRGIDRSEIVREFSIIDERDFLTFDEETIAVKSWN